MIRSRILAAALLAASGAAFAGTADVRFIDPGSYTDLATNRWEEAGNLRMLQAYIQHLARALPPGQVLHVDVLDVDLAGRPRETFRGTIRTMSSQVDPPQFHLRYTLESNGQVLRSGDERLVDMYYAHRLSVDPTRPLYYEKRLLDDWFARTFGARMQAYAR